MKYYEGKINTTFHDSKVLKEGSQHTCLLVILIDYFFRKGKSSSVFRRM